jgi:hypothetical protein
VREVRAKPVHMRGIEFIITVPAIDEYKR